MRRYAEVRVVVDPDYRHRGLGTAVLRELIDIAWDAELESVQAEFVAGVQDDALKAMQGLGGVEVGTVKDVVRGQDNALHYIVVRRVLLGRR
ncbi:MAG: GNAT family N-acetyltransferase [Dehalococcoidia bacterium]|nr:GNAT family N-acetyltransferase [Dehalococcoidia bacterium]